MQGVLGAGCWLGAGLAGGLGWIGPAWIGGLGLIGTGLGLTGRSPQSLVRVAGCAGVQGGQTDWQGMYLS